MDRITIDADLASKLVEALQPVQICDGQGRLLGTFRSEAYVDLVEEALAACPISVEELKRRRDSSEPGRSLREILTDLEQQAS